MEEYKPLFICACASDDKKTFSGGHFGDAEVYLLYRVSDEGSEFIEEIENTSIDEQTHGDPKKAKSVTSLLKKKSVQVLVSRSFGPNIVRIRAHFVAVLVRKKGIEEGLALVRENLEAIEREWRKDGSERKHLILSDKRL